MSVFLTAAVASLLLPPMCFVLPVLAGLLLARRRRALGSLLALAGLAGLVAASTPWVADRLLASLEPAPLSLPADGGSGADGTASGAAAGDTGAAIVVLGGGLSREAPEYGTDAVNPTTLERLRYAAWLHRRTGLPILVSGGRPLDTRLSEAETMRESLATDFGMPPRWVEGESPNTRQNALRSRELLAADAIRRVYLVTHAWHMPRARRAFEEAGFEVVAAPTGYTALTPGPMAWVPSAQALRNTHVAMREWLGQAWYRIDLQANTLTAVLR